MSEANQVEGDGDDSAGPFRYGWFRSGDWNAFFGLMLDNLGGMILTTSLLVGLFQFPAEFVLRQMIPGTAIGVLVGDLIYTGMAFLMAHRQRRDGVTAMPLGLDTPSIFGTTLLILGPSFVAQRAAGVEPIEAARHAWYIGISVLVFSGVFKIAVAPFCGALRRIIPRAGLLGSLTAIALVLISFLPSLEIFADPIVGLVSVVLILVTLTARWQLPGGLPGAFVAVLVGSALFYLFAGLGLMPGLEAVDESASGQGLELKIMTFPPLGDLAAWLPGNLEEVLRYLPIAIPLALGTIVGGIDCTESAATAGDDYPTSTIIGVEGFSTLVAGFCGGIIQTTPYIGHPAYKAMGARAGYTLMTALFVGAAGLFGFFGVLFAIIPKAAIFPILIFIGLEITAQSFQATDRRHYTAVALGCVPALAFLTVTYLDQAVSNSGQALAGLPTEFVHSAQTLKTLANGFIVTGLIWSSLLVFLIEKRAVSASLTLLVGALGSLIGIIHSPLPNSRVALPWDVVAELQELGLWEASKGQTPYHWALGYAIAAVLLLLVPSRSAPHQLPQNPPFPRPKPEQDEGSEGV